MTTSLVPNSTPVTSTPWRKLTPYFARSSAVDRHSSFDASVTRALLSFVLQGGNTRSKCRVQSVRKQRNWPVNWAVWLLGQDSDGALVSVLFREPVSYPAKHAATISALTSLKLSIHMNAPLPPPTITTPLAWPTGTSEPVASNFGGRDLFALVVELGSAVT